MYGYHLLLIDSLIELFIIIAANYIAKQCGLVPNAKL